MKKNNKKSSNNRSWGELSSEELESFVKKLILNKAIRGHYLSSTTKEYWMDNVLPLTESIIQMLDGFIKGITNQDGEVIRDEFITYVGLSIELSVEVLNVYKKKSLDLEKIDSMSQLLKYCEEKTPDFKDRVHRVCEDISIDCLIWLTSNHFIENPQSTNVDYSDLEKFLEDLITSRKIKEPDSEEWKSAFDLLNRSIQMVSRGYLFSGKNELDDPYFFAGSILGALSAGIVTNSPKYLESYFREAEESERLYKREIPKIWEKVKKELGPGVAWWVKEKMGLDIDSEKIELVEGIGD